MSYCIIIPARMRSSRLTRKMLRRVGGMSIVEHTWRRAVRTRADPVVVATDDDEIAGEVRRFGGLAQMTGTDISSGTARVHQAAEALGFARDRLIINIQGDEPLIEPALVDDLADFASTRTRDAIATVAYREADQKICDQADTVKLVCDKNHRALYFSRRNIPWADAFAGASIHIGVYAYTLEYLRRFVAYPPAPLEQRERLEQLRALWHGDTIAVLERSAGAHIGIDTEADLNRFTQLWTQQQTKQDL